MSEPWEKGQKPVELPNPELNPLQNPTLGRNLGRWAQVYFTSPPEKREQAVGDLLRELKTETEVESPRLEESSQAKSVVPHLICRVCQQPNELEQRFCGLCGTSLRSPEPVPAPSPRSVEQREEEAFAPRASAEADELEWLREKSLSRLSDSEESSGRWKYAVLALGVLLAAFAALQWFSSRPDVTSSSPPASSAPAPAVQPVQPPAPVTTPATAASTVEAEKQPRVEPAVAKELETRSARVLTNSLPERASGVAGQTEQTTLPPEGGAQELYLAQGYLEGKHGMRDSREAAKWLWKAVAKQNTAADVLLANLYMTGDGVAKSCDQARLLLVAAAQKGQPNAAERLRSLESGGCR